MRGKKDQQTEQYVQLFIQFANRVESHLKRWLWICCCLLIVCQILLRIPMVRGFISGVDRLEGVPISSDKTPNKSLP